MSKTLVTYFSVEGNTAKVAEKLASAIGAEIYEIKPRDPYTAADIRWTNPMARCNREKLGKKDVPIHGKVEDFDSYDVVFIGFPIWYACAPNVVNTFVKGYDWTGKKVALFATSGGSGIGRSAEKLAPYMSGKGSIVDGKLFSVSAGDNELKAWAEGII